MTNQPPIAFVDSMILASLLFWGAWGICDKKGLSYTTPVGQLAAVYCFSPLFALAFVAVLTLGVPSWHLTGHILFFEAMGSFAYFVATAAYLTAMSKGEASLILGASSSYPVVAQILAYLLLKEDLVPARIIGCLVVISGIVVIGKSAEKQVGRCLAPPILQDQERIKQSKKDLIITVAGITLAVFGWAIRGIFDKFACEGAHPLEVNLGKYVCDSFFALLALVWVYTKRAEINFFKPQLWKWAAGSAFCLAGGGAAYFIALSMSSASYIIAITGCYPVVMYLLAILILKEKFNVPRAIGIGLITLGGIITQTTQHS